MGATLRGPVDIKVSVDGFAEEHLRQLFYRRNFQVDDELPAVQLRVGTRSERPMDGTSSRPGRSTTRAKLTRRAKSGVFINNPQGRTDRPDVTEALVPAQNLPTDILISSKERDLKTVKIRINAKPSVSHKMSLTPPTVHPELYAENNAVLPALSQEVDVKPIRAAGPIATGMHPLFCPPVCDSLT